MKFDKTILIRRKGGRGDLLMLTPTLRALRKKYPSALIVLQTLRKNEEVLLGNPNIDLIVKDVRVSLRDSFDIFFEPIAEKTPRNKIDVFAEQCRVALKDRRLEIYSTTKDENWARAFFKERGYIALHTGATWHTKEWPIARFEEVVQYFLDKGYGVVEFGDSLTAHIQGCLDCRQIPFRRAAAAIKECSLFLGIDSGLAHVAKAVRTPAVVIYGCVSPGRVQSDAVEYPIWQSDIACRGCSIDYDSIPECRFFEPFCLTRTTVDEVIEKVEYALDDLKEKQ